MLQTQTLGSQNQQIPRSYREPAPRLQRFNIGGLGDREAQTPDQIKQLRNSLLSHSVLEQIIATINTLSRNHLFQLRQVIDMKLDLYHKAPSTQPTSRIVGTYTPKDRSREDEWLSQHRDEYAGQWVALDGDRLLAHGTNLKEVAASAQQSGVTDALFVQVEPSNALPWAGF
jgi:Family of unknown function (DUF5678)